MNLSWWAWLLLILFVAGIITVLFDIFQKKHSIARNFPLIGRLRFLLEEVGPELRQYIVTDNNSELPFSRDERRWIYASSKSENNYFGFGTDNDLEKSTNYIIIKHSTFPYQQPADSDFGTEPDWKLPCAKTLGATRNRAHAFVPRSIVNVSGMSYGSLGPNAVMALNKGVALAGCLHSTGEGSISPYHQKGGELVWQIGTGYFGARNDDGAFSFERFLDTVEKNPSIRAIEIKLSQGAKPGLGGMLPGKKVTPEIAAIRGIPVGVDCHSPSRHSAFSDADSLLDFAERIADATGLPIGIKSAVGNTSFFEELAQHMDRDRGRGIDFITIDGGEGGTGAAPLSFTDHVSLPFMLGFGRVRKIFDAHSLGDDIVFIGSGRLGLPDRAFRAFTLGVDMVNVARESMLSIGCIQAQRCHTGHCPTGVATSSAWLNHGLDPEQKSVRASKYLIELRKQLALLSYACGISHPSLATPEMIEILEHS
ncbi:MAG TPA: FMN-binding glutamate synthase family protein [Acidimicrobiia bacterium]|nr:FMN-binding glutamate synthase family protein [Acidimicrobiia bacterium]